MSSDYIKTIYHTEVKYGGLEEHTLYAHHLHSVDTITMYDENFRIATLFIDDNVANNKFLAIERLYRMDGVEFCTPEEIQKIKESLKKG